MYRRCSNCGKTIKRKTIDSVCLCLSCRKKTKIRKCLNCDKLFYPQKSIRKYCSKSCSSTHTLRGRILSKQHKENLSRFANPKGGRCKFFKVYNTVLGKKISVQGTWELKYAQYLNENGILWLRGKLINVPYELNGKKRTYYPDFYLIDTREYIEVKGYLWPPDKEKMDAVCSQHQDKIIKMLVASDLSSLGIDLSR